MESKRELETKAKNFISTSPDDALKIFQDIWENFPEEFNEWDTFFALKTMRVTSTSNLIWAKEIATKYPKDKVCNIYAWLIFDKCVKGRTRNEIIDNENFISELLELCPPKDLSCNDEFPCPTTISIFKLCDAHSENLFNARKINSILNNLNYNLLSNKSKTMNTQVHGDGELSSDLEKYFSLQTKALLKLGEYKSCIELCQIGLEKIAKFHNNNDLWFKMRIALSEDKLGNHEKSENLFSELLNSRAGNDKWFLYRDIAEVYYEQRDYLKAWKFAVDAALYGNEPHFLIGLYLLQARLLFKLERSTEGKTLAELISSILKEQVWKDKEEYNKLFKYYSICRENIRPVNEIIKEMNEFWSKERYGTKDKVEGVIISVHKNGKVGRIKDVNGSVIDFHKKDFIKKLKSIDNFIGVKVEFYQMVSFDGKNIAECISILELPISQNNDALIGKIIEGTVKNVVEFGIFIRIQGAKDGLLHKNNLPKDLKENFKEQFLPNKKVKVKIEKVTDKGIQLSYVDFLKY